MKKDYSLHSGERVNFVDAGLMTSDCLARYEYIASDLRGFGSGRLTGADVFCGNGYGTSILARALDATILAIDGSAEAIAQATQSYLSANIFFAAKLFPFELPRGMFDFIASIESMEHLRDDRAFAAMLCRSLRQGGRLYLSVPDEEAMVLERMKYPWHYQHYRAGELDELIEGFGMTRLRAFSTTNRVTKGGDVIGTYYYQAYGETLLPQGAGDTHLVVYERQ